MLKLAQTSGIIVSCSEFRIHCSFNNIKKMSMLRTLAKFILQDSIMRRIVQN
jgi:hypothetical protein